MMIAPPRPLEKPFYRGQQVEVLDAYGKPYDRGVVQACGANIVRLKDGRRFSAVTGWHFRVNEEGGPRPWPSIRPWHPFDKPGPLPLIQWPPPPPPPPPLKIKFYKKGRRRPFAHKKGRTPSPGHYLVGDVRIRVARRVAMIRAIHPEWSARRIAEEIGDVYFSGVDAYGPFEARRRMNAVAVYKLLDFGRKAGIHTIPKRKNGRKPKRLEDGNAQAQTIRQAEAGHAGAAGLGGQDSLLPGQGGEEAAPVRAGEPVGQGVPVPGGAGPGGDQGVQV